MRTLKAAVLVVVVVVVSAVAGCSTYTVHAIPGVAPRDAAGHTEIDGIRIGAQPYQDFDSAQKIFNQSPMVNGVLPILLVVDNSSEVEIEMTRVRIELETSNGKRLEPLDRLHASREAAKLGTPAFLWVFSTTDTRAMAFDWAVKCVPDLQVCKRGRTVRTFLYYRVGKAFAQDKAEQCTLIVPFEHADRAKRQSVKIPLTVKQRKQQPEPEEYDFDVH